MESSYGVGIRNRYELLIDAEGDPEEVLQVVQQQKDDKKKKKEHINNVDNSTKGKVTAKPVPRRTGKENQEKPEFGKSQRRGEVTSQRGSYERRVKFAGVGNREERDNRSNRDERSNIDAFPRETAPRLEGSERGRGSRGMRGGRGRGRARGRGFGQDGFDSRGKREFDRMSGSEKSSSVRSFEKREGGGAHNWGRPTEVVATDELFGLDNFNADLKHDDSGEIVKDETEKEGVTEEEASKSEVPEEPKEITFQEWKAQQGERQKPTFNIRKAGEGESANWKKGYTVLTRDVEQDSESEYEDDEDWVPHGRQKQVVNINIEFSNPRMLGGRGRGRRGRGDGGGRGRGGRQEDNKQSAPRVDDEKDFPCL